MKLIKLMLAGIVVMAFSFGQDQTQDGGQPPQGPPPCDPNATYPVADPGPDGGCGNYNDCNGNGAYDAGEPCGEHGDGPDRLPFEDVDTDNDGLISRDEARDKYGTDPEGNDVEDFDQKFDDVDTDNNGSVDPGEYYAAQSSDQDGDQGPPTCNVCGYTFAGEGDHHGHCDKCDFVFTSDNDQHGHCDQCDYIFSGEGDQHGHCDKCDHIYSGDDEDRHGHCDHEGCDFVGNSDADWQNHHHDDGGGDHEGGDGDHDGGPPPNNHWDGNCGAMMHGESEYWLDSDGDGSPDDGPYAVWHEDADGNPVNCGGPGGPPPTCAEVDTNGDGSIDREEARAKFGHDPQGNPNPNFDQEYDEVDANGDGVVDCAEHDAAVAEGQNNN